MKKECVKNLLSMNKNALRFLHDADGFNFEKPYFIAEQPGKFTANTVIKAVRAEIDPKQCKIVVFVVSSIGTCCRNGLYFATLNRGKLDGTRRNGVSYWDYRNTTDRARDIDYCWGVGDFERLRKNGTEKVFIIAQDKTYIEAPKKKAFDSSSRYILINANKCGDGRGNTYIGEMDLKAMDGSGARFKYEPYNTFYGYEIKSADIENFIDHSGYLLRPHRFELMQKAEQLRKARKQAEADSADFTEETAGLQTLTDEARRILSGLVMDCTESDTARDLSYRLNAFSRALSYFSGYMDKLETKKYTSIDRITADIDTIKAELNYCITGNR